MVQAIVTWTATAKAWAENTTLSAFDAINQLRLLTPTQATILIVVVTMLVMPVIQIWLRRGEVGYFKTILASSAPGIFLIALLQVPSGFAGTPDENCEKYGNGKLVYGLLDYIPVPKSAEDFYGEGWFVLLVRAHERWGDDTHQCRLSLSDPKVRDLMKHLEALSSGDGASNGRNNVTFTFGGRNEVPNVKIRPTEADPKTGPPEVPTLRKQDI